MHFQAGDYIYCGCNPNCDIEGKIVSIGISEYRVESRNTTLITPILKSSAKSGSRYTVAVYGSGGGGGGGGPVPSSAAGAAGVPGTSAQQGVASPQMGGLSAWLPTPSAPPSPNQKCKFKIGDRIKSIWSGNKGVIIDVVQDPYCPIYVVELTGYPGSSRFLEVDLELDTQAEQLKLIVTKNLKCKCGSHTTYGVDSPKEAHSVWCDIVTGVES